MEQLQSTFRTIETESGLRNAVAVEDQRATERRALQVSVRLLQEGFAPLTGRTVDVSGSGVSLMLDLALPRGQIWQLDFDIPYEGIIQRVNALGQVAHHVMSANGVRVGFQFKRLSMASMIAISRYVR
jgi:hypothetical protein